MVRQVYHNKRHLTPTGFNTGEKTEIFWGIRSYELAIEEGTSHFLLFLPDLRASR
jgi:hypothetical protein